MDGLSLFAAKTAVTDRRSAVAALQNFSIDDQRRAKEEIQMKKNRAGTLRTMICGAALGLAAASISTAAQAETGLVRVVFTKAGFIVGVGGGRGILTFRGHHYPFTVSGMSFGATIGASTTQLAGRALNMHAPSDIAGTYNAIGAGAAVAGGAGGVQLQNAKGVVLQLHGVKVGVELSAAVGGVTVTME
jgi:hypothetical protein